MIETAVFSWQSNGPLKVDQAIMACGAVRWAARHFPRVILVADAEGQATVGALGLPFTERHEMPAVPADLRHIYDLPKHYAQLLLCRRGVPAVQIDWDVFLRRPLPARLLAAPFLTEFCFRPARFIAALNRRLPVPRLARIPPLACAGGIMGGCDLAAIAAVAEESIRVAADPRNRAVLARSDGYQAASLLSEVSYGAALAHCTAALLPPGGGTFADAARAGYVHLAGVKRDRGGMAQAAMQVQRDFPAEYLATARRWDALWEGER